MLIGYTRVSKADGSQSLDLQRDAVQAEGAGAGVRATLARPGAWLFGVCFVLFSIQWLALMTWLPTFLIETQGRSLAGASLLTALIVSVTALGAIAGASLMHRGAVRWLRHEGRPFAGAPALVHEYGATFRGSRPD